MEKKYEEYAYVLDFFRRIGDRRVYRGGAIVQLVGEEYFTLLEAVAKEGVTLRPQDRIYVGRDGREHIAFIMGRINYEQLTAAARAELPLAVENIVRNKEKKFVEFFNTAQPITPRMHSLELIPGIGKRYMWVIIEEREKRSFESFEDLRKRTNIPNPVKLLVKRIMDELTGETRYRLFTRPPHTTQR